MGKVASQVNPWKPTDSVDRQPGVSVAAATLRYSRSGPRGALHGSDGWAPLRPGPHSRAGWALDGTAAVSRRPGDGPTSIAEPRSAGRADRSELTSSARGRSGPTRPTTMPSSPSTCGAPKTPIRAGHTALAIAQGRLRHQRNSPGRDPEGRDSNPTHWHRPRAGQSPNVGNGRLSEFRWVVLTTRRSVRRPPDRCRSTPHVRSSRSGRPSRERRSGTPGRVPAVGDGGAPRRRYR